MSDLRPPAARTRRQAIMRALLALERTTEPIDDEKRAELQRGLLVELALRLERAGRGAETAFFLAALAKSLLHDNAEELPENEARRSETMRNGALSHEAPQSAASSDKTPNAPN